MSLIVTLTLDDDIGAYLERVAADQGRTPAEVAAWIVTEDLRREQRIDANLLARLDESVGAVQGVETAPHEAMPRERAAA